MTSFPSKPFTTMAENFQLWNGKKTQNHFQSYSHFILSFCTDILTTDYKNSNTDSMIFCTLLFERCWHVQANTIILPGKKLQYQESTRKPNSNLFLRNRESHRQAGSARDHSIHSAWIFLKILQGKLRKRKENLGKNHENPRNPGSKFLIIYFL